MFEVPKFLNIYTECVLCFPAKKKLHKSRQSNTKQLTINCERRIQIKIIFRILKSILISLTYRICYSLSALSGFSYTKDPW